MVTTFFAHTTIILWKPLLKILFESLRQLSYSAYTTVNENLQSRFLQVIKIPSKPTFISLNCLEISRPYTVYAEI